MALPAKRTLGELRAELRVRLGFAAVGASGGPNDTTLDSFLRTAQEYLYWQYELPELRTYFDLNIGKDQNVLDYPDTCEPRKIKEIWAYYSGWWHKLKEGINSDHESTMDTLSWPMRFELRDQIRFWPKSDSTYKIRIDGLIRLNRFTQDSDRATLDDQIVFDVALMNAKLHYRHPDAQAYADQVGIRLSSLKAGAHGTQRYFAGEVQRETMPRPVLKTS